MTLSAVLTLFAAFLAVLADPIELNQGFDNATLAKVKTNLENIATHRWVRSPLVYHPHPSDLHVTHSWEIGTALEALTELDWPVLSAFHGSTPPTYLPTPNPGDYVFAKVNT